MSRIEEIAAGLAETEQRIVAACDAAGRDRGEITLIAVTKTYPASDVEILAELGITQVGENRHPEAGDKHDEVAASLTWNFLGGLQTNKAGAVARYADVVHSVDRAKLARSLDRGAEAAGRVLGCLVQVDFDTTDPGRSGVAPGAVDELADVIADAEHLRLDGLMTVAPLDALPRPCFDQLVAMGEALRQTHPTAVMISAGMSDDLEHAVAAGATHLRVGRSILGDRPATR